MRFSQCTLLFGIGFIFATFCSATFGEEVNFHALAEADEESDIARLDAKGPTKKEELLGPTYLKCGLPPVGPLQFSCVKSRAEECEANRKNRSLKDVFLFCASLGKDKTDCKVLRPQFDDCSNEGKRRTEDITQELMPESEMGAEHERLDTASEPKKKSGGIPILGCVMPNPSQPVLLCGESTVEKCKAEANKSLFMSCFTHDDRKEGRYLSCSALSVALDCQMSMDQLGDSLMDPRSAPPLPKGM